MDKSLNYAPLALFVYNRPEHTRRTVEALKANYLASDTHLFVFCDAHRDEADSEAVRQVREYVGHIDGFASVNVVSRERNLGLADSIIDGVGYLCERFGRVIVLEDDLVSSPHFLSYMNDALNHYADDERVCSISAYMYPVQVPAGMPDTVLLPFPMSWGWATWKRAWALFDANSTRLSERLRERGLSERFDRIGPGNFMRMLRDQIAGRNNSWFIRWHASLFLAGKLSLAPVRSLIDNIGLDGTGVHCSLWRFNPYRIGPSATRISVAEISREPALAFDKALRGFFIKSKILRYVNALNRLATRTPARGCVKTEEPNEKR